MASSAPLTDSAPTDQRDTVVVHAPGRLHLGFLDPSGSLGRPFGSVGVMIDGFETVLELSSADRDRWQADDAAAADELDRVRSFVARMRDRTGRRQPLALRLRRVLPAHSGFGSGTQLALAVGRGFAHWQRLPLSTPTLAGWLGRGLRSGIGIAGFDGGGLLVDGGPGRQGEPAPVTARLAMPPAWRIVVVQDESIRGLSGAAEKQAIAALAPLPAPRAAEICHQVLMRVLPGAAAADFATFAAGVQRMQAVLGEHFMPAQNGSAWASPAVARLLQAWRDRAGDGVAIGQSSWGPTGFAFVASAEHGAALLAEAAAEGRIAPQLRCTIVAARNDGARVERRGAIAGD